MAKSDAQLEREISRSLATGPSKRWVHRSVAQKYEVPEDVVRRIYQAVQLAKKQQLRGGFLVDLIERQVGRKLIGDEYAVAKLARDHLQYNPEGGYQGPQPTGEAAEPMREHDAKRVSLAARLASEAERDLKKALTKFDAGGYSHDARLAELRQVALGFDVAADAFDEAGPRFKVRAGTLRMRAKLARDGHYRKLATYESP